MRELLEKIPVVPVVVIDDAADAVPLARALVAGEAQRRPVCLRKERQRRVVQQVEGLVPPSASGRAGLSIGHRNRQAARRAGTRI
jgi:2-dehydro-3-deoxyphosphogluconate aldolase/(4S)-4-hydroxy-2-oxoglutarate aldolase